MSALFDKLSKTGIKSSSLRDADVYFDRELTSISQAPILNIAMSGELSGGIGSGVTVLAGPSKHFKSNTGLLMVAAYMNKHKDATCLFYDSEFGAPPSYWSNFGIDIDRVLHVSIEDIEDLKFDLPQKLEEITKKDKVIIFVDSIGNLASKKEGQDALDGKAVADMSRAREIKSFFRIITPKIKTRNIPAVFVAHTYQTMEMYSKAVVSGGCLEPGTKIQMADGTFKNIEDVLENDLVSTLDGPKPVTNIWNPETLDEGEPECIEIEFEDGTKVVCSESHRFLVKDEWIEAKDLNIKNILSAV